MIKETQLITGLQRSNAAPTRINDMSTIENFVSNSKNFRKSIILVRKKEIKFHKWRKR